MPTDTEILDQWATAWSSHDIDSVLRLFTDNCIYEDVPTGAVNTGKHALRAFAQFFFSVAPDFKVELSKRFETDKWAAGVLFAYRAAITRRPGKKISMLTLPFALDNRAAGPSSRGASATGTSSLNMFGGLNGSLLTLSDVSTIQKSTAFYLRCRSMKEVDYEN